MSNIKHFKNYSYVDANIQIHLDMSKVNRRIDKAQWALDIAVMNSMLPFMPPDKEGEGGRFQTRTRTISTSMAGTGRVCAAAPPYGRFLYMGKAMVDKKTGKGPRPIPVGPGKEIIFRYRKGAELKATSRPLTYSAKNVVPEWFEASKEKDLKKWVQTVEEIVNGR